MTDITELAQRLKLEVHRAVSNFNPQMNIKTRDLKELVEALEKAQQKIDELENDEVRQRLANAEHQLYMAELAKNNLRASRKAQFHKRKAAEQRIAELESRAVTAAAADVLAERKRQVTTEGWTPEHDDQHVNFEMAIAGGLYAISAVDSHHKLRNSAPSAWPWDRKWWKPDGPRRDLVKAGALILAEIERLDRAAGIKVEVE
ncbi:ead/Ea22-like family protein [Klebsiella pneumoniae]|uniref:ead/Ea22-like family protein n=1 Tax=Klebsiella pneumoniae TaxID=573 RepID=UPI0029CA26A4|nr:ead/Ea22-like family protein [Klebsiella pneumoniae]WPH76126.1 ead/Ea22-like family protein [Klebsiella pneumoniae]WPH88668.1 ead/Ea22-like family protein [Klebsiella pneumoniae]WPI05004.1 ead/Ea22-like family protein [Klebsiella pneumoniae]